MDKRERALRAGSLEEMHQTFGRALGEAQLRLMGNLTKHVPAAIFREACQLACINTRGGFPPGVGDVVAAALELAPGGYTPGQGLSKPRWHQRTTFKIRGGVNERPQQLSDGPRGEGATVLEIAKGVGK
jgi:hypothetical protein